MRQRLAAQGRVILALDGLQPDVGHEVLWVIRDCLSGEVLLARSLLSGPAGDLAPLLREVASRRAGCRCDQCWSDRDPPRGGAGAAWGSPPTLPVPLLARGGTADLRSHAKTVLKKHVRGVRPIERAAEQANDPQAAVVQGYCAAVRSAVTDDGQAPLAASGLKLKQRLEKVADSLERVVEKGAPHRRLRSCNS